MNCFIGLLRAMNETFTTGFNNANCFESAIVISNGKKRNKSVCKPDLPKPYYLAVYLSLPIPVVTA